MENFTNNLAMGEYGAFVWSSFAVATLVIVAMLIISLRSLKKAQKTLHNLQGKNSHEA